jgi:hypothetical protein
VAPFLPQFYKFMKTAKLIALRAMYYDRDRSAGEEFMATPEDASALIAAGSAKLSEDKDKKRYERRDMRAEK